MTTVNLKRLQFSPDQNPLIEPAEISVKKKFVRSGLATKTLLNAETMEVEAASVIHQVEEKDDEHFVKVFAAGVAAAYELNRTSARVFQAVLHEYEKTPMSGGFVDSLYLAWFNDGLDGKSIGMSEKTFQRGLKTLIEKGFLAPRSPNQFWVNPALFFKGDRVMFIKEYKRREKQKANENEKLTTATEGEVK
jgi:hypothetical protein